MGHGASHRFPEAFPVVQSHCLPGGNTAHLRRNDAETICSRDGEAVAIRLVVSTYRDVDISKRLLELPRTADESSFFEDGCPASRSALQPLPTAQASLSTGAESFGL